MIVRDRSWQFVMSPRLTQMGRNGPAVVTTTGYAPRLGQRDSVPLSGPEEHRRRLIMFCHNKEQSKSRSTGRPEHSDGLATAKGEDSLPNRGNSRNQAKWLHEWDPGASRLLATSGIGL